MHDLAIQRPPLPCVICRSGVEGRIERGVSSHDTVASVATRRQSKRCTERHGRRRDADAQLSQRDRFSLRPPGGGWVARCRYMRHGWGRVDIGMVDHPSLASFHGQMRRLWLVDQYLPVVGLGVVATAHLGSGLGVALTALVPPAIWLVVGRVRVTLRRRAGLEAGGDWRSRMRSIIGGQFLWCEIAVFLCMTGVWAAATVFPVAVVCVFGAKVREAVPVDVARLPARVRQLIDATPGLVGTLAVPGRRGCRPVVGRGDALYITRDALQGDEAQLSGAVAREVAHVRLGHRRTSVTSALGRA
jgi:hypothetical protein